MTIEKIEAELAKLTAEHDAIEAEQFKRRNKAKRLMNQKLALTFAPHVGKPVGFRFNKYAHPILVKINRDTAICDFRNVTEGYGIDHGVREVSLENLTIIFDREETQPCQSE